MKTETRKEFKRIVDFSETMNFLKKNERKIVEIYEPRIVTSLYFDTINFDNYYDNIDGVSDRVKHRIRWYNDFFLNSKDAVFEIKRRKGLLVNKETLLLDNFHLNENNPQYSL